MEKRGQCLCGAVKFSATVDTNDVGVCHCGMCRRWTAGPFFGVTAAKLKFEDDRQVGVHKSSAWAERGFAKCCGTPLFWRMQDKSMTIVSVNALDDVGALKLDHEVYIDEKPGYYSFAEKTHQMTGADIMKMFTDKG
jgi:hypothetical protein